MRIVILTIVYIINILYNINTTRDVSHAMDMIIVIVMLCISFINENGGETNKWRTHHLFYKYIYIYLYVSDTVLL